MLIYNQLKDSQVNGPGNRSVIWVSGCNGMSCAKDCWNSETHIPDFNKSQSVRDICKWFLSTGNKAITFSGGEPMQQAYALHSLILLLKSKVPDISIGMYTGYTEKELEKGSYKVLQNELLNYPSSAIPSYTTAADMLWNPWASIRSQLDFAVMGRFNKDLITYNQPLVSSSNQKLTLFSNRYTLDDFTQQEFEIHIRPDGLINITGFPIGQEDKLLNPKEW